MDDILNENLLEKSSKKINLSLDRKQKI